MVFKKKELKEKLGLGKEEIDLVLEFQKKLPILTEDAEGFCVDARTLREQLRVSKAFSTWIKTNLENAMAEEHIDYEVSSPQGNNPLGGRPTQEYLITVDVAKQISMFTGANSQANEELKKNSRMVRKYFILMEKSLKSIILWNKVRYPEKELYIVMCDELNKFLQRNYNKEAKFYDYINEANSLNLICLGARAKDIREYLEAQDKNTREHLLCEYNEYLCRMEDLNIMYLRMNIHKMQRYDLIKQGFKALYPNASYVMANKDLKAV